MIYDDTDYQHLETLTVIVTDDILTPVQNVNVNFSIGSTNTFASLSSESCVTQANGQCEVTLTTTISDLDVSDVAEIRNSTGNAIVLVAHHNKGTLIDKQLHKDQIQGGKQLTNFVSNVLQIGESKISTELRVAKITKIRDEQSELENIPFKLQWDNDSVTFSRGSIIPKEEVHFIEPKQRWEIKVLLELAAYEDFLENPQFNRERLRPFLAEDMDKRKESRLLNRWVEWGFVKYVKYNTYEFNFNSIKDLQS